MIGLAISGIIVIVGLGCIWAIGKFGGDDRYL